MKKNIRTLTQTAALLAVLLVLQVLTKGFGQYVTGTCVNCVLAVTVLLVGLWGGLTVAILSPVFAFLLGIAPNVVTVIPIMAANGVYVAIVYAILDKKAAPLWRQVLAVTAAAAAKAAVLYVLVVQVVCGLAADLLLGQKIGETVVLAPKMLEVLPAMFSWPQLVTALAGGAIALCLMPALKKALGR